VNERDIALNKVVPYLKTQLHWQDSLISQYGRVPVPIGSSTCWADLVFSTANNLPWIVIEVKKPGDPLEQAIPQVESYSLILGAHYFCVTDGDNFNFYQTGNSIGKSIRIQGLPPIPYTENVHIQTISHAGSSEINYLIDQFFIGLKQDPKFRTDTKWHHDNAVRINKIVFNNLPSITPSALKDIIDCNGNNFMLPQGKNWLDEIYYAIDKDFGKVKSVLGLIRDVPSDPVNNMNRLLDNGGEYHIRGAGIMFVTQFLAGAYPDRYVVFEPNASKALEQLKITNAQIKPDAQGYIYFNDICTRLFKERFEERLQIYTIGWASAAHNFLWHWYANYRESSRWYVD
jgi:hypothetical protein